MTELEQSLAGAIANAEREVKAKYQKMIERNAYACDYDAEFFAAWMRSYWGITIGEKRILSQRPPGGPTSEQPFWRITEVKSEEQLVMFKLTYA